MARCSDGTLGVAALLVVLPIARIASMSLLPSGFHLCALYNDTPLTCALQWQTYGYIPSALPDSNCFGGEATSSKVSPGQRPSPVDVAGGSQQPATAPEPGPLSISRQVHTAAALPPLPPPPLLRGCRPRTPLPKRA